MYSILRRPVLCVLLTAAAVPLASCSGGGDAAPPIPGRGSRTLALDVGAATGETYDQAFQLAKGLGIDDVKVSLDWNLIETAPNTFDFTIPDIVESYYPANNMPVTLVLRPINTNALTLPADIAAFAFDHATVIQRFQNFLIAMQARMPSVTVTRILIGNEIDVYLGTDPVKWAAFTVFFQAVRATARSAFGTSVPISTIGTFAGHVDLAKQPFIGALVLQSDFVAANYYPLNDDFTVRPTGTVATDFAAMVARYPGRSIVFQECGLPSGALCNSSETLQRDFVRAVFQAWDLHQNEITHIDFAWQTDVPAATVDQWVIDYGMTSHPAVAGFREYLATLGLRTATGQPKLAWTALGQEAAIRGW